MLDPGGWPEVDETTLYDQARRGTKTLSELTEVLETWQAQRTQVFDGGIWSGGAADVANGQLGADIDALTTLQNGITTVITWHNHTAGTVELAKSMIIDNVDLAHRRIAVLDNDPSLDTAEQAAAIKAVVTATHGANVSIVTATAEQILVTKSWKPPANALQDLLDRKTPPPFTPFEEIAAPDAPSPVAPPSVGEPLGPPPPSPSPSPSPSPTPTPTPEGESPQGTPPGTPPPGVTVPPGSGLPPVSTRPPGSPAPSPGTRLPPATSPFGPDTVAPSSTGAPDTGSAVPLSPAASTSPQSGARGGKGIAPASVVSPTLGSREEPSVAPAAATGPPPAAVPPAAASGAAGAAAGRSTGSGAPVRSKPLGAPPIPKPGGTIGRAQARTAPTARPQPPDRVQSSDAAPMPVVPVSAARAARDSAAASTADAARRQGGPDPLQLARRIAAALNAPGSPGEDDLGFFWVTAVTKDGAIVVANSYGLAYIPDGVQLPGQVHVATADEAIPAAERARWATYPVMAVQGWAAHHGKTLRAVIATEQQLANSDPGAVKLVLQPDDIPDTGDMSGRSRLEVVNPDAAERLSATSDLQLGDLLPPVPIGIEPPSKQPAMPDELDPDVAAQLEEILSGEVDLDRLAELMASMPTPVDTSGDRRDALWFDAIKPMSSQADGRARAHLRAFHAYSAHAKDIALAEAHHADDPAAQRAAAADWLYWRHLAGLLDQAMADVPLISPS